MALTRRQSLLSARTFTDKPAFPGSAAGSGGLGRGKLLITCFFASIAVTRYRVTIKKATHELLSGLITAY
jgi:hypothetical protein